MAQCVKCAKKDNLFVWVVADPYYGYGHYATLRCENCPADKDDWRYDSKHKYDPDYDNPFLGLPHIPIGDYSSFIISPDVLHCFECCQLIDKNGKVGLNRRPSWIEGEGWEDLYVCFPCFKLQKAVKLEKLYENKRDEFQEKLRIYAKKWKEANPESDKFDFVK